MTLVLRPESLNRNCIVIELWANGVSITEFNDHKLVGNNHNLGAAGVERLSTINTSKKSNLQNSPATTVIRNTQEMIIEPATWVANVKNAE